MRLFSQRFPLQLIVLLVCSLFASMPMASERPMLRLAGPPWLPYLSETEPHQGLATEIVLSVLAHAGYDTRVAIKPWRRVLAEAEQGEVDVLIGLWFNEDREKIYAYSDAYFISPISLIVKRNDLFNFEGLNQLRGLRVGLRKGASFGGEFDRDKSLDKVYTVDSKSMLQMLSLDRLDVGVDDRLILETLLNDDARLREGLIFIEPELTRQPLHMAVPRNVENYQEILDRFNASLKQLETSGDLQAIYRRYGVR